MTASPKFGASDLAVAALQSLKPGALGPNQRGPGWGYQPGSGLENHSAEHRENKTPPLFSLPFERATGRYASTMVLLPRPPRPGLALSVVGAINRVKHRVRRMRQRGTIAELLLGLALVACAVLLIAPVIR